MAVWQRSGWGSRLIRKSRFHSPITFAWHFSLGPSPVGGAYTLCAPPWVHNVSCMADCGMYHNTVCSVSQDWQTWSYRYSIPSVILDWFTDICDSVGTIDVCYLFLQHCSVFSRLWARTVKFGWDSPVYFANLGGLSPPYSPCLKPPLPTHHIRLQVTDQIWWASDKSNGDPWPSLSGFISKLDLENFRLRNA